MNFAKSYLGIPTQLLDGNISVCFAW